MAVELDHSFTTSKSIDESFAAVTDLERVVPAVQGGTVLERRAAVGRHVAGLDRAHDDAGHVVLRSGRAWS